MLWLSLLLPPMCIVMHGSGLLESSCYVLGIDIHQPWLVGLEG